MASSLGPQALVGRRVKLAFDAVDATPDLADEGAVEARVKSVKHDAERGGPVLLATVEAPALLRGMLLTAWARYEDEPLEAVLDARASTVNASIEGPQGRAVAGGLAQLTLADGF